MPSCFHIHLLSVADSEGSFPQDLEGVPFVSSPPEHARRFEIPFLPLSALPFHPALDIGVDDESYHKGAEFTT